MPVSSPSIVFVDNNPNWENATNPVTNLTSNKPTSFTHSQSKTHWSDNTNEKLANILSQLTNTLNANQISSPNTNSRGTKCYDLKLELRLYLGKDLREVKGDCINGKV